MLTAPIRRVRLANAHRSAEIARIPHALPGIDPLVAAHAPLVIVPSATARPVRLAIVPSRRQAADRAPAQPVAVPVDRIVAVLVAGPSAVVSVVQSRGAVAATLVSAATAPTAKP